MGSPETDARMEGRKKSRGENLQDRQIKRYIRSQRRKARKENQSQARAQKSTDTVTDASESKKTEIKSEKNVRDVQSRLEPGQEMKKKVSKQNDPSKKEQDTSRTTEWVEEMNKINDQKSKEKKKVKPIKKKEQSSSTSNE